MRTVEVFLWRVPPKGKRRGYTSPIHRTVEDALREYGPAATLVPNSMKLQTILETDEEMRRVMQSAGFDGAKPG